MIWDEPEQWNEMPDTERARELEKRRYHAELQKRVGPECRMAYALARALHETCEAAQPNDARAIKAMRIFAEQLETQAKMCVTTLQELEACEREYRND